MRRNTKHQAVNESFSSSIIRRLNAVNTTDHIGVSGKPMKALSKSGMMFLLRMPVLWDKLSDDNITIYADSDIASFTPDSVMSTHKDENGNEVVDTDKYGNPIYVTRTNGRKVGTAEYKYNLGSKVDNYDADKEEEEALSELVKDLGRVSKRLKNDMDVAKQKHDREAYFEYEEEYSTIEELRGNNGLVSAMYRQYAGGVMDPSALRRRLGAIGDLTFLKGQISSDEYALLMQVIDTFKTPLEKYDKAVEDRNKAIRDRESDATVEVPEAPTLYIEPKLKVAQYSRGDRFSKYDTVEETVYPTMREYISDILPNDKEVVDLLAQDNIEFTKLVNAMSVSVTNGNRVLDKKLTRRVNQLIAEAYGRRLKPKVSDEDRTSKVEALRAVLNKYTDGRVGAEATGAQDAYAIFRDLYRNAHAIRSKQEGAVLNNLENIVFNMEDSEEFKIVVLADKNFGIHYVLSYFLPSASTFMLMKSPDSATLFGWKRGDTIHDIAKDMVTPAEIGEKLSAKYIKNGVDTYDSYSRISIDSIKRDKDIAIAIIIGGGSDAMKDDANVGARYTLYGKYGNNIFKKDFYGMGYDDEHNRVFIGNYGDGKEFYDPNAIIKVLNKHNTPYTVEGKDKESKRIYIDVADENAAKATIASLKEILKGQDIDYKKLVGMITAIDTYTKLYQAFELPTSIRSHEAFSNAYNEVVSGGDFGMEDNEVETTSKRTTMLPVIKYTAIDGTELGYGSIGGTTWYISPDVFEAPDGKIYGMKADKESPAYGGIAAPVKNDNIENFEADVVAPIDTVAYDKMFFANYLELSGDSTFSDKLANLDLGFGVYNQIKRGGKLYKKMASKVQKDGAVVAAEYLRLAAVEDMVAKGELVTVYSTTMESVTNLVKELNEYITPRCPYIKFGFDAETGTGTLRQHFYGVSAMRAGRTGITTDNTIKRMADANAETAEIQENNKLYQKALIALKKQFAQKYVPSIAGVPSIKKYLNDLEKNGRAFGLRSSFNGYDFFNGDNKPGLFEETVNDLLDVINAKLMTKGLGIIKSEDGEDIDVVEDVYMRFASFVSIALSTIRSISNIKSKSGNSNIDDETLLNTVANKIASVYDQYDNFVDGVNADYNLGIRKRM